MKKVLRISKFFVLSGIISLLFSIRASSQTYQDSCIVLIWEHNPLTGYWNPDSVMFDSCKCEKVGSWYYDCEYVYAKKWFQVMLPKHVLNDPAVPIDSVIIHTWEDIDSSYSILRQDFEELENQFGLFYLRKKIPYDDDTNSIGSRTFLINFNANVKIDTVVRLLKTFAHIEVPRYVYNFVIDTTHIYVDDQNELKNIIVFPNPASEFIEITVGANGSSPICETYIQIYNVFGECILSVAANNPSPVKRFDISFCPNGLYFLRIADEVQKFFVLR